MIVLLSFILFFFWSDRETTRVFEPTAPPENRERGNNNIDNNNDDNYFQSSKEFSNQNYETFPPMFSERYNIYTEEPSNFDDDHENYETEEAPHQYYFTPTEEFVPTRSFQRDEL